VADVKYDFEIFPFGDLFRRRLTKVVGTGLRSGHPTTRLTGAKAPQPLSQYDLGAATPGYRLEHTERGHIIGLQFGGPEDPGNLVPMYAGFNGQAGGWGQFETKLADILAGNLHRRVTMTVTICYDAPDTAIPSGFIVSLVGEGHTHVPLETIGAFTVHVHPPAAIARDDVDEADLEMLDALKGAQVEMMTQRWRVETAGVIEVPGIRARPLSVGAVPAEVFDLEDETQRKVFYLCRPYAVLDYLCFVHPTVYAALGFGRPGKFDNTQPYSEAQKSAIRKVNILAHLGFMVSDIHGLLDGLEPYNSLYIGSADAAAQVDHIMGKAGSGSNTFSNARLVSKMANLGLNRTQAKEALNAIYADRRNWPVLAKRFNDFWTGF
jgi:hypothetical protein